MRQSLTLLAALGILSLGVPVLAQETPAPVSMELRDASVREALKQLFDSANQQYQLDNDIRGFVTLKISKQPFENALKLLLRSGSQPLTYKIENGVYIVSIRRNTPTPAETPPAIEPEETTGTRMEFIPLTYIDPKALEPLLGPMLEVQHFRRWMQNNQQQGNGTPGAGQPGQGQQPGQMGQPGLGNGYLGGSGQFGFGNPGGGFIIGGGNGNGLLTGGTMPGGRANQPGRPGGGRGRG